MALEMGPTPAKIGRTLSLSSPCLVDGDLEGDDGDVNGSGTKDLSGPMLRYRALLIFLTLICGCVVQNGKMDSEAVIKFQVVKSDCNIS